MEATSETREFPKVAHEWEVESFLRRGSTHRYRLVVMEASSVVSGRGFAYVLERQERDAMGVAHWVPAPEDGASMRVLMRRLAEVTR